MKSMTGFGKASFQSHDLQLDISVKTVNGRFLETKIHSPRIYAPFELEIRKKVSQSFLRGNVEVFITRKSFGLKENVHFNEKLAEKWLEGYRDVCDKLKLEHSEDSKVLLNVPDFFRVEEPATETQGEKATILETLGKALEACDKERTREGHELRKDIGDHIKTLKNEVDNFKKLRASSLEDFKVRFVQRLKKLDVPGEIDEQRLAQEVALQVDKSDVSEEIQRLEAHISAIQDQLAQDCLMGKKLDFYAQELLREVNTIGSKSASAELTQAVVNGKAMVEKFREQVQNVE